MKSAIYEGLVRHRRFTPVHHEFRYPLFMMYLDLAELPDLFRHHRLYSAESPAAAWFRRKDYLGDPELDLDTAVRETVQSATGKRPDGPIRVLTHLRTFGYVMNPVTFYYCFRSSEDGLDAVVAEITNTPWGERHTHVLKPSIEEPYQEPYGFSFGKEFHVSPFMPMDVNYEWLIGMPGNRLTVHTQNYVEKQKFFDATLLLSRREITNKALTRVLLRHPWMTARVAFGIYWQAARLWIKRAPFHTHPAKISG